MPKANRQRVTVRALTSCGALLLVLGFTLPAWAHKGPPFLILTDEPAGDYLVSVWTDPDIGEASFYIVVKTPDGEVPDAEPTVSMWTEPVSGRLARVDYAAERQTLRGQMQYFAAPYFDQRDMWKLGFQLQWPDGRTDELTSKVESTPPGLGLWDLAIYIFPFALLGVLWAVAMVRRARHRTKRREAVSE